MKKTTFWSSVIVLMFMGTLLFFVGIENYQDEMLPKGVRESFLVVSGFGLIVSMFGCLCGVTFDKKNLI
jgi:ABC-type transport system involved in multi-copper enzyme maturation permease subunit